MNRQTDSLTEGWTDRQTHTCIDTHTFANIIYSVGVHSLIHFDTNGTLLT